MKLARRSYCMRARAAAVARTRRRILEAALALFGERPYDEIALARVARRARTTEMTVIRHFRSKPGLVAACVAEFLPEVRAQRFASPPGDVPAAVRNLLDHYEAWGPRMLRLLAQDERVPALRRATDEGRALHRAWVARTFGPLLARVRGAARRRRLAALVAATDVHVWAVLRRDEGLGRREAEAAMRELVAGICGRRAS